MTCRQQMIDAGERLIPRSCPTCGIGRCKRGLDAKPTKPAPKSDLLALATLAGRKVYVAGPMRGIPEFNFPAFNEATMLLRKIGCTVFNPAEKDNERHGTDISKGNLTGDESIASAQHGFDLREALGLDLAWICGEADAVALLPGWQNSKGAKAERATADALGLQIIEL